MPDPVAFLSPEWVVALAEECGSLPAREGTSVTLATVVVGGPAGAKAESAYRWDVVDGRVASTSAGAAAEGEVDLLVTQPYDGVLPPNQNSIGLIVYNTALEMARDAQVTLYAKRRREAPPTAEVPFRMSYVAAPTDELMQTVAGRYPRWARLLRLDALADAHPGYARAVRSRLDHDSPDIVHVMNYWGWSRQLRDKGGNGARRRKLVLEMQSEWLSRRIDLLEQQVEQLNTLAGEVAALRTEMRAEFADVRAEMRAGFEHTRAEFADVRAEMRGGFAAIHDVLISLQTQITDNHRHMLVLHEEVLSRIATLGERWDRPPTRRRKKS